MADTDDLVVQARRVADLFGSDDELIHQLADRVEALEGYLERWQPCEPCQDGRHDDCTGACSSNCCAFAFEEAENAALTTRLGEALRALERTGRTLRRQHSPVLLRVERILANPANVALLESLREGGVDD